MMTTGVLRLLIFPELDGERFDRAVAAASGLSRRRVRSLIADGAVWRNGAALRVASRQVETGDVVDLLGTAESDLPEPLRRPPDLRLLHDDRAMVAVDKPAGMLVQPAEGSRGRELALDECLLLVLALREGRRPYLHTVHRIDRLTSGVVLFARTPETSRALARMWSTGRVVRDYLAVVEGAPEWQRRRVEARIRRDPDHRWRFVVHPGGREAATELEVLERRDDGSALIRCGLHTGRTHQVRVHLAHIGHPVVGDLLYGARPGAAPRPLLHAWHLGLDHPGGGDRVELTATPPPELGLPPGMPLPRAWDAT